MHMVVSTDMFGKAVNENEESFRLIGLVSSSVELSSSGAGEPVFLECGGGHGGGVSGSRARNVRLLCPRQARVRSRTVASGAPFLRHNPFHTLLKFKGVWWEKIRVLSTPTSRDVDLGYACVLVSLYFKG